MGLSSERVREAVARARLYLVFTRRLCRGDPAAALRAAIAGGVEIVQLREPEAGGRDFAEWARAARKITVDAGVPLVVNDRPDVALLAEADGVHVGQDDLAPEDVRALAGNRLFVGLSTHDPDQIADAVRRRVDYIGFGPCFDTATKGLAGQGLAAAAAAAGIAAAAGLPCFAIGGVDAPRAGELARAGVRAVAVSSAICAAADPAAAARALRAAIDPAFP